MIVPKAYKSKLNSIPFHEVSLGYTTITIFTSKDIKNFLISENKYINQNFIAIGNEDLCGDIFCIDTSIDSLPVFLVPMTNDLKPEYISSSFDNFVNILILLKGISANRDNPVKLEQNPVPEELKKIFLNYISIANPDCEKQFWEELFEL
jgi:hypothetical protein